MYESIRPATKNTLIADTQQAGLRETHAASGRAQHNHPFRETDMSGGSMFHGNAIHQATSICMATNGKEEYENDIMVFDSGRKDIFNKQILSKNYSQ